MIFLISREFQFPIPESEDKYLSGEFRNTNFNVSHIIDLLCKPLPHLDDWHWTTPNEPQRKHIKNQLLQGPNWSLHQLAHAAHMAPGSVGPHPSSLATRNNPTLI
jgi:hypothetical protein